VRRNSLWTQAEQLSNHLRSEVAVTRLVPVIVRRLRQKENSNE